MSTEPQVILTKEPKGNDQWGKKLFYRVQGRKHVLNQRVVLVFLSFFAAPFLIWSLVFDEPPVDSSLSSTFRSGDEISSQASVNVPLFNGETIFNEKALEKKKENTSGRSLEKKNPFQGLSLIPRSKNVEIPPGTCAEGVFLNGASNGFVRAELSKAIRINGETLLPAGAILIGQGQSTEERLFVNFKKAVLKDGLVVSVEAQACDISDQIVGIKGSLVGYRSAKLAAGIALNFASGLSQGLQESEVKGGVAVRKNDPRNALLNGASSVALEQSKDMISDYKSKPPIQEIDAGTKICVVFAGDGSK